MNPIVHRISPETAQCSLASLEHHLPVSSHLRRKLWLDRLIAALLLIPGAPLIGLMVLAVRATSAGPGIYRQKRVGFNGQLFWIYKVRTMRIDAEVETGPVWCDDQDPRVTRVGAFLRMLNLDELPQLYNVLRGDMSLVGPRPERPEFATRFGHMIPAYNHRHAARPGVTGLAQINLPPDTDLQSVRRKLMLDLEYIEKSSLWLDLRIAFCTLPRLGGFVGRCILRTLGVFRSEVDLPARFAKFAASQRQAAPVADKSRNVVNAPLNNAVKNGVFAPARM